MRSWHGWYNGTWIKKSLKLIEETGNILDEMDAADDVTQKKNYYFRLKLFMNVFVKMMNTRKMGAQAPITNIVLMIFYGNNGFIILKEIVNAMYHIGWLAHTYAHTITYFRVSISFHLTICVPPLSRSHRTHQYIRMCLRREIISM